MNLRLATESFMAGFSVTRSLTHPYVVRHFDGIAVMEDGPRKRGDRRNSEYVAVDLPTRRIIRAVENDVTGGYAICAIYPGSGPYAEIEAEFRAADYRLIVREPFFAHSAGPMPHRADAEIRRVADADELAEMVKLARRRQMKPSDLTAAEPQIRLFTARKEGKICGWVKSIAGPESCTWVSDLYVSPDFRRQGIGGGLMSTMIADDRDRGFAHSILLASHAGAMLYPQVGYERIGTLLLFKNIRNG